MFIAKDEVGALDSLGVAIERARTVLDSMSSVFEPNDRLLRQVGLIPIYYWFFRACAASGVLGQVNRQSFEVFEAKRNAVKQSWAAELDFDTSALSQFNRLSQTPNDTYAIEFRVAVLVDQLLPPELKEGVLNETGRLAFMVSDFD